MRNIKTIDNLLQTIAFDPSQDDATLSLALLNRLQARIARRESRFRQRALERAFEKEAEPRLTPAA